MVKKLTFAMVSLFAVLAVASCEKEQELVAPASVSVNPTTLTFAYDANATQAASQTVSLTATREWTATVSGAGITVSPSSGAAAADQTITITSEPNTAGNTTAVVTFSAGTASCGLVISREGALGNLATVAEVIASAANTEVETQGTVAATCSMGIVIADETGNIFVYKGNAETGDLVTVKGTRAEYNGAPQISDATVTKVSSGTYTHPEPTVLDAAAADALVKKADCVYIQYEGTLTASGNYYNVTIDGASTAAGSIYGATDALNLSSLANKRVVVTGYYVNTTGTGYLNTIVTKIEESTTPFINVSDEYLTVTAEAGTKTFTVASNVEWTVSSSDATNFAVSKEGETVTITYTENTGEERSATVTVTPASSSNLEAITVKITQSAPLSGNDTQVDWTVGSSNQTWAADSHTTYGSGYAATNQGIKVAYYKNESTSTPVEAYADHIRVYKSSELVITAVDGSKIKSVVLTCTGTKYCFDMSVSDGTTVKADTDALTITWEGSVDSFEAQATGGQVRISKISVIYGN